MIEPAQGSVTALDAVRRRGLPVPTAEQYQEYLDTRDPIHDYLEVAARAWFARSGRQRHGPTWLGDYGADSVTFIFCATHEDDELGIETEIKIPIIDLLPEYGERRAVLVALGAR